MTRYQFGALALFVLLALTGGTGCGDKAAKTDTTAAPATDKPKIGFIVKSGTEMWFQTEWKFAQQAADKDGFDLVKIDAEGSAEKVDAALDNLAAQGAKGVIICTPDTKLGPAIVAKCKEKNLKLMSVDDRLIGADGKPLADVPHLGISAYEIGKMVGQSLVDEAKKRNWNPSEVGAAALTVDEIETCRERVQGATEVLVKNGFPAANIYRIAWKKPQDIPAAVDAANVVLTQHGSVKKWLAFSSNDDGVLGFVRASEQRGLPADAVIGVGINGTSGVDDLKKPQPTGFFASVLLSPKQHGYDTAEAMYKWVKDGVEPAKETYTKGTLIDRTNFKEKMAAEGL